APRQRVEFVAEPQRAIGNHDRALRRWHFALRVDASQARIGLVVEPGLRQEDREQSEQDRKAYHDDGTGTQVRPLMTPKSVEQIRRANFALLFAGIIGP